MIVAERQRARRSDAGTPRLTSRDSVALEWLSQMYGAPQDVVARLLGTTVDRSYEVTKRWDKLGQIQVSRVDAGHRWVYPTQRAANSWLGWPAAWWRPRLSTAAHTRAVAEVRLAFCGSALEGWTSERTLRHDIGWRNRGEELPHVSDGLLSLPNGQPARVEVELTPKDVQRTFAILKGFGPGPVLYVVSGAAERTVRRAVKELREWAPNGDVSNFKVMRFEEVRQWSQEEAWAALHDARSGGLRGEDR